MRWLKLKLRLSFSVMYDPCNPIDWSPPGNSVHGILQARKIEWVVISSPRVSPQPKVRILFSCGKCFFIVQFLSHVPLFVTPWTAARQTSLSFTISQSLLKHMSIESVMPSNHLILCRPLLLLPSIFPSIRLFSNE